MTPTEAAVGGAMYAFVLGFLVYREIKPADLPSIIVETSIATASVLIIIAAAQPLGWVFAYEQTPVSVVAFFQELKLSPWQILLALNITMLVAGCFMESIAMLVIATPYSCRCSPVQESTPCISE